MGGHIYINSYHRSPPPDMDRREEMRRRKQPVDPNEFAADVSARASAALPSRA